MVRIILPLCCIILLMLSGCSNKSRELQVNVTRQVFLNDLSSASGITWHNNKLYVVGDDAPWLYILDEELSIIEKIKISGIDSLVNGRMPKSVKPDFESIEYVNDGGDEQNIYLLSWKE